MKTIAEVEVHFHDQDKVSVHLTTTAPQGEPEHQQELLLFCLFALRQLVNLGRDEISEGLAQVLCATPQVIGDLAEGAAPGGVELIGYPGRPARKRFTAQAKDDGSHLRFVSKAKLGLLSRGAGYYSPTSVVCLLRRLAMNHRDDSRYLARLAQAAMECGDSYKNGSLRLGADVQLAYMIATGMVNGE